MNHIDIDTLTDALRDVCPANDDGALAPDECTACGTRGLLIYGLCGVCYDDANAMIDARRGGDEWLTHDGHDD